MKKGIICILICMLMVITTTGSMSATTISENISQPLAMGNILYVGGSGPNNYTKIQDAIDDANDGDTVFVYDDSSPYYENIIIDTSVMLRGEDKNTTVIDGQRQGNVITVVENRVTITGFTITDGGINHHAGVWIEHANWNKIIGNIIRENHYWGICLNGSSHNTIASNRITQNDLGIEAGGDPTHPSNGNVFTHNVISSNEYIGVGFGWSRWNVFYQNSFSDSKKGINFWHNNLNVLYRNSFTGLNVGLELQFSHQNLILCNNFLDNQQDATFLIEKLIQNNRYLRNYWNGSSSIPHFIQGGFLALNRSFSNPFKWIQIDWYPAKIPYEPSGSY